MILLFFKWKKFKNFLSDYYISNILKILLIGFNIKIYDRRKSTTNDDVDD